MKTNELSLAAIVTLFCVLHISAAEPPKGFKALFNGQDLSGWHGLNPYSVADLKGEERDGVLKKMRDEFAVHWRVENGELINNGQGPYATTDGEFGDIELLIEYKTVAGADSGIYLRGTPQVQIWDKNQKYDPEHPDWKPYFGSGGLFNNTPNTLGRDALRIMDKPFGQWNTFRIIQIGARTWVWLNDRPVVEGAVMENYWDREKSLPSSGPIMLEANGGKTCWRNIFVRTIGEQEGRKYLASHPQLPEPDFYDMPYGKDPRQVLHFWKAESDRPTPLLFFIHGGGWTAGGRMSGLTGMLPKMLDAGISVASVEYRFIKDATADGVVPPVKGPLHDTARALQFVRSKAKELNINKERIGASGGSAGACTSLWLAFHPDLADPGSDDPVARESTRLYCAAVDAPQTTLDPKQMKEWTPNSRYGAHAFGISGNREKKTSSFQEFVAQRDTILPWIAEYSPYALVSKDDPPVFLKFSQPPALGQDQKDPTHTANFGVKLQEHCKANGVECELVYPGAPKTKHTQSYEYLIDVLKE